ncbi:MAG: hypothetical protein M1813_006420 [Trichoglossum hirsutum]|nr:MAG: hypothetical protein M1813_007431 [Trichoglossum hirsutum]KAI9859877.1 MAG: hypothetical protein M1813_006420 [Trichoglossum hirsutum]
MSPYSVNVKTGGLRWVDRVVDACIALIRPHGLDRSALCEPIADCFYNSIDEVSKANLAARQTIIALWPGIISSVAAVHPDASDIAYDNLLWASIFAMTSGGTAGYAREKPKRYLSAPSAQAGRVLCLEADVPSAGHTRRRGRQFFLLTYGSLLLCLALYTTFVVTFLSTLRRTVLTWSCSPYWLGSLWYFAAGMPALLQATYRLLFSNVILFEETTESRKRRTGPPEQFIPLIAIPVIAVPTVTVPQQSFIERGPTNSIRLWMRILANQVTNRPYRLLVLSNADNFQRGFFELSVAALRIAIFIIGSATQGSLIIMPTPFDTLLLVLILLTTFIPRVLWYQQWLKTKDGVDRVVFCQA